MDHVDPQHETDRLRAAGELIAEKAKKNAARFSRRIPAATRVDSVRTGPVTEVVVKTNGTMAPNAAPFEYAEHHPLFGDKKHMYRQPHRPYMVEAADEMTDEAVDEYANVVDDWCKDLGFTE